MRKIISGFACSLDGYITGPNGEYDWILINDEMDFAEQMKRYDTFLIGRKTYDTMRGMSGPPTPDIKNYVFSKTLTSVDKNFILVKGDIETEVKKIKEQPGKEIAVFGGASLLASLLDLKLVDQIEIAIIPVLLGAGKPMVDVLKQKVWLTFISSRNYSNGTVQICYAVNYNNQKSKRR